jgi:hypothetical protein
LGDNKFLAKLASDLDKPVALLWGVGAAMQRLLPPTRLP